MKITTERAIELAKETGYAELFAVGDRVVTHHGHEGTIKQIDAYGDTRLWGGWSCYVIAWPEGGAMIMDFCDAHYTLGGCLKRAQ